MPLDNDNFNCIIWASNNRFRWDLVGFSVNAEVNDVNLQEISLVSQRLVYDQIASSEVKLHEYPISKEMLKHC